MIKQIILAIILSLSLFSDETLQQIKTDLDQAEKDYNISKKMFNPWYGGPLITASGNVMPPKYVNIYSLLTVADTYSVNTAQRKRESIPNVINVSPLLDIGVGIVNRLDTHVTFLGLYTQQSGQHYFNIGDTTLNFDVGLLYEKVYTPALKLILAETFPTGNYENFETDKAYVSSTGSGSYATKFGLATSKVVWWWLTHPMQFRYTFNFQFFSDVNVKGINSYGGGLGTDGTVSPGFIFATSLGYEFSVTQKFVLALDVAYEYHDDTTFIGNPGIIALGVPAPIGSSSRSTISLAPALEYVFNPSSVVVGGVWFSVYGTSGTPNFIAGFLSYSYGF